MESSYHVFVLKEVNTCFTSYAAVNLCQKRSRNLDKINPSQVSGSSETCQITYNTATGAFMTAGDSWSISTLVQEKAGFSPGLTDNALYSMALGNHQTRIAGRSGEFLTAGLFLLLGLVLPLLLKPAIALDKFLLGFFYDNSEKLQATDLARGIMLLLGLVVSVIGAIWWCILLFG